MKRSTRWRFLKAALTGRAHAEQVPVRLVRSEHWVEAEPGDLLVVCKIETLKGVESVGLAHKRVGIDDDWTFVPPPVRVSEGAFVRAMPGEKHTTICWSAIFQPQSVYTAHDGCDCDCHDVPPDQGCPVPPEGWWCSRAPGHDGPCAARRR